MRVKVIIVCVIALVGSMFLTGCCSRIEMKRIKDELAATQSERDSLRARLRTIERAPKPPADEATDESDQFQQQVIQFMRIRDALQQREDELAQLRQAALSEAQAAQALMETLATKLQAETEKVNNLQSQLQQAQKAVSDLQEKLDN